MVTEFVRTWFSNNSASPMNENDDNENYLTEGFIDSLKFLDLITTCEKTFAFQFSDDDFLDDNIFTIKGLIRVIEMHIGEKK